jgi:Zn-dependent peptidase ImmA (M78 family)
MSNLDDLAATVQALPVTETPIPPTLEAHAQNLRDLFGLQSWEIVVVFGSVAQEGDGTSRFATGASCTYEEPYRIAKIILNPEHTEAQHREYLMHEMLHLVIAPIEHQARSLLTMLPRRTYEVAQDMLMDSVERVITPLAKALYVGITLPEEPE